MSDCLFCKIIQGTVPSDKVYEDDNVIGFKDIAPLAKEHFLFVHKSHSNDLHELIESDPKQLNHIFRAINKYTKDSGALDYGYRVVSNIGKKACQSVFHTHIHVLSGEQLKGFGA